MTGGVLVFCPPSGHRIFGGGACEAPRAPEGGRAECEACDEE